MSVDVSVTVTKCDCNEVRMISKLARHKIDEQVMICFYFTEKLYVCWKEEPFHHHHHHLFLNREGRWGTTDDFATSFPHLSLFSTTLSDFANSRPVHSLMLSSHLFLCLPCLLPPLKCLARWFWPDLMNGRHDHTSTVCVSLRSSGGLRVDRLPAGSWHGFPRW